MSEYPLCKIDDLADPGSYGFDVELTQGGRLSGFLVRKGGEVFGYRNQCPHLGAPLEWQPHQFLDLDNSLIQCAMHGALFQIRDGLCLRGPCVGNSLQSLTIVQRQYQLLLRVEDDAKAEKDGKEASG